MQAFIELDRKEPGIWALSQGENSLSLMGEIFERGKGMLLELHRAIPIPKENVPIAEILEFKERRRDELLLLRKQLDGFVASIEKSLEQKAELHRCLGEIDVACANLLTVGKEWRFPGIYRILKLHLISIRQSFYPL